MVERQHVAVEDILGCYPAGCGGVSSGLWQRHLRCQGQVGHGHHSHPRVAPGISVAGQLFQVGSANRQAGLLGQLARGGLAQGLIRADEAAGQREHARERILPPRDQQDLQAVVPDREHHEVDGDGYGREVARIEVTINEESD